MVQEFSREFCEISKNTFLTEHLWATASIIVVLVTFSVEKISKDIYNLNFYQIAFVEDRGNSACEYDFCRLTDVTFLHLTFFTQNG